MKITKAIYDAAWAKRDMITNKFTGILNKDIAMAQSLPFGQQMGAAIAACERYEQACGPAVKEWQRDLGILKEV